MARKVRNNMKVLIISGTPKTEGLSCSCANAVYEGIVEAGSSVELIRISDEKLASCVMCDEGWGDCLKQHTCRFGDDGFTDIQKKIAATGDDTQKYKADDIAYAKLPGCCQYERKK